MWSRLGSFGLLAVLFGGHAAQAVLPAPREIAELLLARGERLDALSFNYGTIERPYAQGQAADAPVYLKAMSGFYGVDRATGTERYTRCASAPKRMFEPTFEYEVCYQNRERRETASIIVDGDLPFVTNSTRKPDGPLGEGSRWVGWLLLNEVIPSRLRDGRWGVLRVEQQPERAVVIGVGSTEYWLAPDLGYAILRARSVGPVAENGNLEVREVRYGNHREVGGVHIPTTYMLSLAIIQAAKGQEPTFRGFSSTYAKCTNLHCNAAALEAMQSQRQVPWLFGGLLRDPAQPQVDGKSLGYGLHDLLAEGLREAPFGLTEPTPEELLEYGKRALAAAGK
ncbi:MAG: hypothetical protein IT204_14120 [Fimbriimonadaceae bacterium]|nr:hypothetical protein [Fimbriimonadaceae bacterium]